MEFIPYKITETLDYMFYQIPMELFFNTNYKGVLSLEAKVLYGILLNQLTLSIKNNWQDENGDVYIILTRERAQKMLDASDKHVTKAFKQLNKCKLIFEKKQGQTKPNLIYVGKINHDNTIPNMIRKNYDSRVEKNTIHDSENLRPNYNNRTNSSTLDARINAADLVIFLDYSSLVRFYGVLKRFIKNHGKEKEEIPGCKEKMDIDFIKIILKWNNKRASIIERLSKANNEKIIIFKNRKQLNEWYTKQFNANIEI